MTRRVHGLYLETLGGNQPGVAKALEFATETLATGYGAPAQAQESFVEVVVTSTSGIGVRGTEVYLEVFRPNQEAMPAQVQEDYLESLTSYNVGAQTPSAFFEVFRSLRVKRQPVITIVRDIYKPTDG